MASTPELLLRHDCDVRLLGERLAERFVVLPPDEACAEFVSRASVRRHSAVKTLAHRVLRQFFSDFDVNGVLGMYSMHLLSAAQWQRLLGAEEAPRLLDVGAGDGLVTHALAQCFSEVTATETSAPMVRRLRARGFASYLLDVTHHPIPGAPYDAISLLNVLDRCASPLSLLASVRKALTPRGRLILALVVPYRPFFFSGRSTPSPIRPLPLTDTLEFEVAARRVCDSVLEPAGFIVESLARAPYLSWGDSRVAIYELDALVIVARRRPAERAEAPPGATD